MILWTNIHPFPGEKYSRIPFRSNEYLYTLISSIMKGQVFSMGGITLYQTIQQIILYLNCPNQKPDNLFIRPNPDNPFSIFPVRERKTAGTLMK